MQMLIIIIKKYKIKKTAMRFGLFRIRLAQNERTSSLENIASFPCDDGVRRHPVYTTAKRPAASKYLRVTVSGIE